MAITVMGALNHHTAHEGSAEERREYLWTIFQVRSNGGDSVHKVCVVEERCVAIWSHLFGRKCAVTQVGSTWSQHRVRGPLPDCAEALLKIQSLKPSTAPCGNICRVCRTHAEHAEPARVTVCLKKRNHPQLKLLLALSESFHPLIDNLKCCAHE
eukprot:CAMPEP_0183332780 /NCGR_PEP_ID=MMETSP0164_2-20130417/1853_1 /TAXON_ID=221442 /ORGANISM="Coccolithus pelagicus ssp braarudi, Strain PLY182g" /LENGTH=154 /DNA_ID=CAMNT_0025501569 /DNA_START=116 /DNA_END=581 /DNA_ORIENTATION=+